MGLLENAETQWPLEGKRANTAHSGRSAPYYAVEFFFDDCLGNQGPWPDSFGRRPGTRCTYHLL
jgi:hypothetical protein